MSQPFFLFSMSIIRLKSDGGNVYAAPFRRNADIESFVFGRKGEFSPFSDLAFRKHVKRLSEFSHRPNIIKLNGMKNKIIKSFEPFWYR